MITKTVFLNGIRYCYKFDRKGKVVSINDNNGGWKLYERDSFGNLLKYEDSDGFWEVYQRDAFGSIYEIKTSHGTPFRYDKMFE